MTASVNMTRNIFGGLKQISFSAASPLMCFHFKRLDFSKVGVWSFTTTQKRHVLGPLSFLICQYFENNVAGYVIWQSGCSLITLLY